MTLDSRIVQAINESVAEENQPEELASRLIAWFAAATSDNEDISDYNAISRHLEVLYQCAEVKDSEEGEER